ncbi:hypothetical protein HW555_004786 [Spodoptera exigua]|uniref:Uncharacterized protein n=1 Tax=Spodoptera exigua TaxID=7107 RepID=A0A835GJ06_SPOEX|nr:hypothetical protein HW555_004786 [Spodoptera exigua]
MISSVSNLSNMKAAVLLIVAVATLASAQEAVSSPQRVGLSNLLGELGGLVDGLLGLDGNLKVGGGSLLDANIKTTIGRKKRGLLGGLLGATGNILDGTLKAAGSVVEGSVKAAGNVVEGTVKATDNLLTGAKKATDNLLTGAKEAKDDLVSGAKQVADDVANGLSNGIQVGASVKVGGDSLISANINTSVGKNKQDAAQDDAAADQAETSDAQDATQDDAAADTAQTSDSQDAVQDDAAAEESNAQDAAEDSSSSNDAASADTVDATA